MADPETDAAIAAKWPEQWARANNPALRNRSKARQQIRQRYRLAQAFDAFKQANPDARCGNCGSFKPMPNDAKGAMHCEAESDFYGYQLANANGLCVKWSAKS
jgi:hypothetical protein